MTRRWTFGRRIAAGFGVMVALTLVVGVIAVISLRGVATGKDRVIEVDARLLIDARRTEAAANLIAASTRAYFMTGDQTYLDQERQAEEELSEALDAVAGNVYTAEGARLVQTIREAESEHKQAIESVTALRRSGASFEEVAAAFEEQVLGKRSAVRSAIEALVAHHEQLLADGTEESSAEASAAVTLVTVIVVVAVALAVALAALVTRWLRRAIGVSVGEIRNSSTELQAAANQQATGAKEQTTAMSEISTTITELLATSRQIAESAQRVAEVASQTAEAGRSGSEIVTKAELSMTDISRQVELIVNHMIELGEKSQRIGEVLDIVTELAEQTNILAINSTIEAAGAGEAGKRFAVVADEIRRLADRVADSTKEVRGLIDVVRAAVNTTVMATEIGSKAVASGSKQFGEVATAFGEIAGLVTTTTEAAREIELSTKQQASAVEQVNVAISSVAQTTRETEAGAGQTLQTASQLTVLSRELERLVEQERTG